MNLSRVVVIGGILLLPQPLRIWVVQGVVVSFAFLWSLEPVEQVPGSLFAGGTLGYAMGSLSWAWLAVLAYVLFRLPGAGRRARAQVDEHMGQRPVSPTPAPAPAPVRYAQPAPKPAPTPKPIPAPTPTPPPGPQLIVVTHGKRVRREGQTRSGIPMRDRRTVDPDTI